MASKNGIAAVIDIGSSVIRGVVATTAEGGRLEILAFGAIPAAGIKRGLVVNIEEFSMALRKLTERLEEQAEIDIAVVDVAIAGQGVQTRFFEGFRYTQGSGIVTQADIDYLFTEAKNMPVDYGHKIYHIFPQHYTIDDDSGIRVPVGHAGRKVNARFKLLTAPRQYEDNLKMALSKCNIKLGQCILSPVAIAQAAATYDEKEAGVALIDIGSGTTKISVFVDGNFAHAAVVPFAGEVITRDIREGCAILPRFAEQLKVQYGQALGDFAEEEKVVTIAGGPGWESKEISFKSLAYIIQARLEEIIDIAFQQIENSGLLEHANQGIILTGGTSNLRNILQILKFRTGMDARMGGAEIRIQAPRELDRREYLTALGMLKIVLSPTAPPRNQPVKKERTNLFNSITEKITKQIDIIFSEEDRNL